MVPYLEANMTVPKEGFESAAIEQIYILLRNI